MSGLKFSRPLIAFIALDTGFSKAFLLVLLKLQIEGEDKASFLKRIEPNLNLNF